MLHEMNPTSRFTSRVDAYRRFRPDYPAALFDMLLDEVTVVADVGAGTGISSLQMAQWGTSVMAVEPNRAMREAGAAHPGIRWVDGSAEATTLEDRSVDLVVCFQSFHWFDPEPAIREFLRILRPGGTIAAIWNERDDRDPFTAAYGELVRRISENHPAESRTDTAEALYTSDLLGPVRVDTFPHQQKLDRDGLRGRAASTSYLPSEGPRYEELVRELDRLLAEFGADGEVTLRYVTSLYRTSPV